jgi:hypothetical protein
VDERASAAESVAELTLKPRIVEAICESTTRRSRSISTNWG